jgi:hypothetical protein
MSKVYTEEQVLEILAKTIEMMLSVQKCRDSGLGMVDGAVEICNDIKKWPRNLDWAEKVLNSLG